MKKVIESFIPYIEMSKLCFFMCYEVRDAYKEYGNDLYSFIFSDSNSEHTSEIVNCTTESISVADDVPMDSFDDETCLSSGNKLSVDCSNDVTQASVPCKLSIGPTM